MRRGREALSVAMGWMAWVAVACCAQSLPASNPAAPAGDAMPAASPAAPASDAAPCPVVPQPVPCGGTAKSGTTQSTDKPNASEKFPFPGETSDTSASPNGELAAPGPKGVPLVPNAPGAAGGAVPGAPTVGKSGVDGKFPFPDEDGRNGASGSGGAGSSSSSSSSSSNSGDDAAAGDGDTSPAGPPDAPGQKDSGDGATPGRRLLHRVNPIGTKLQSPDEREAEDLKVASFYSDTGNLQGEYLRSQDAVKTIPDDPAAHFALAEAARKLDKREEAIAEYNECLKLDPSDKEIEEARKELKRLKP